MTATPESRHDFAAPPAPLVLGLVIAPILEQSLRQSLIMSNADVLIFFRRPLAAGLIAAPSSCWRSRLSALGARAHLPARRLARQARGGGVGEAEA